MQEIVFDDRYEFIPPHRGRIWPWLYERIGTWLAWKREGVGSTEVRGVERMRESLDSGDGIILAPNHCRLVDPIVMGELALQTRSHFYAMASWGAFRQGWFQRFSIRRMGAFSVHREAMDRAALDCAIDILTRSERPLIVFPEGVVSRTNDRLGILQEGTAFLARTAARKREQDKIPGRVVIHPIAIKYRFDGDLEQSVTPVLAEIEARLSWQSQAGRPILDRISRIGTALLALKELEYLGETGEGTVYERLDRLIDHLLVPLESEWFESPAEGGVVERVKKLRNVILPEMVQDAVTEEERARRWRHLEDCYLAQQLSLYPPGYVDQSSSPERILETVERLEEDVTDVARIHRPHHAMIEVGEAIPVSAKRDRGSDPVMLALREQLETMLGRLSAEIAAGRMG